MWTSGLISCMPHSPTRSGWHTRKRPLTWNNCMKLLHLEFLWVGKLKNMHTSRAHLCCRSARKLHVIFLQRGLDGFCHSPKFRRNRDTTYYSVYANSCWAPLNATPVFTSTTSDCFNRVVTISPSLPNEMVCFIPSQISSTWILQEYPPW